MPILLGRGVRVWDGLEAWAFADCGGAGLGGSVVWFDDSRVSAGRRGKGLTMQVIATHDVNDVEHWFNSPKRAEFFEKHGMKVTAFRQPAGEEKLVAVLIETPDMETLQSALATDEAKEAEKYDGVHEPTIKIFVAA